MNIDTYQLTRSINKVKVLSAIFIGGDILKINGHEVILNGGLADIPGRNVRFRFFTLKGLLSSLQEERLIYLSDEEIKAICNYYDKH